MITKRRQIQTLANLLKGKVPLLDRDQLDNDFCYLWDVITASPDKYQALYQTKQQYPDLADDIEDIITTEAGPTFLYQSLFDIEPDLPETTWLWPNWIPRGLLTVMAAWPGIGKTYVALDLAKRIIHREPAPDDQILNINTANVIYVDAEDFLPAISSRATAWGMKTKHLFPYRRPPRDILDLNNHDYQDLLIDMTYDLRPDLIIVDSLSGINPKSENNIEDMRELMSFLAELPEQFNTACLLIHHLRKPGKTHNEVTMHDLRGSSHLTAVARSIIGMDALSTTDPNGPRWLKIIKTNLCPYPQPLAIEFRQNPDNPHIANLHYDKNLLHRPDSITGICAEWLIEILTEEPLSREQIIEMGAEHNPPFSISTIDRARSVLGNQITDTKGPKITGNTWIISNGLSDSQDSQDSHVPHN
jgi:hypothetical protein